MSPKKLVSLITPCFNEEDLLHTFYEEVKRIRYTLEERYRFEHIFCDNGSTDRSFDILANIARTDGDVKVIRNTRNFGILANTYNGIMSSGGDAVLTFLPVDMQDPPGMIIDFLRKWEEGYMIVYGLRAERDENWMLKTARFQYYKLLSSISNVDYPANAGDFQLVDRVVIDEIKKTYIADPFLRMNTFYSGYSSYGIEYRWVKRLKGESRNSLGNMVEQALEGLTSFSLFPLRIASLVGIVASAASLMLALLTLSGVVLGVLPSGQQGILTILVSIFLLGGLNLFALGVMGEYLARVLNQVRARPHVVERERLNF